MIADLLNHADTCSLFADVFDDLVIQTPWPNEAERHPYAISNGRTYQVISFCPFCGRDLRR